MLPIRQRGVQHNKRVARNEFSSDGDSINFAGAADRPNPTLEEPFRIPRTIGEKCWNEMKWDFLLDGSAVGRLEVGTESKVRINGGEKEAP